MNVQQSTQITFTQKQLQNIMRESCMLNAIDNNALITVRIENGNVTVSHPPHVVEIAPEEPVNNKDGH